jgi:hypothetical protein
MKSVKSVKNGKKQGASRARANRGQGVSRNLITPAGMTTTVTSDGPVYSSNRTTGDITIEYEELMGVVQVLASGQALGFTGATTAASVKQFWPGSSGMSRLDLLGSAWEQYKLHAAEVIYRSSVGTSTNGALIMGIDYDPRDAPTTLAGANVLTPRVRTTVWQSAAVRVDPSRAMKAKWHYCDGPGDPSNETLAAAFGVVVSGNSSATAGTIMGEVWVRYKSTFTGPIPQAAGAEQSYPLTPLFSATTLPTVDVQTLNQTFRVTTGSNKMYNPVTVSNRTVGFSPAPQSFVPASQSGPGTDPGIDYTYFAGPNPSRFANIEIDGSTSGSWFANIKPGETIVVNVSYSTANGTIPTNMQTRFANLGPGTAQVGTTTHSQNEADAGSACSVTTGFFKVTDPNASIYLHYYLEPGNSSDLDGAFTVTAARWRSVTA